MNTGVTKRKNLIKIISLDKGHRKWTNVHMDTDICPPYKCVLKEIDVRNLTLIVATIILAGSAVAGTSGYSATLAQPLTAKKELIVQGNAFRCNASTCNLVSQPTGDAGGLSVCRALQRQVGTLTSYVVDGKPFDSERLAKCNSHS
jgi:hypothetical protein